MAPPEPRKLSVVGARFMASLIIGAEQLSLVSAGKEFALELLQNGLMVRQLTKQKKTFLVPFGNCAAIELLAE